ncbi:hypothetical protein L1987_43460 [Smallanthus sonchifolius]|uniref:Uncharacterized protein n=1 Tax=Smallanthus sonchifolius TaxID=185202 RepID=A0ACB9GMX4_9ASTR|nr:hypothetical protein L1987_43460 [Smallanthus sonchifolius]
MPLEEIQINDQLHFVEKPVEIEGDKFEGDKIDCLIDLDDVFIDDWEIKDAEIEFEKDDEGIKYATHEGFVIGLMIKVLGNDQEKEEGEIVDDMEEKGEQVEASDNTSKDTWSERRKTWFKTIPKSPPQPVLKSKYV